MAVYTPSGDIGDQGVHLGCRVTRVQVGDEEYGTVGDHHTAVLRNAFDGKGAESVFTDWVTTETVETTACGHRRTRHWHRRPLIHRHPGTTEVDRPVADQAFVIQSTSWGLVETCAYLAPDPEEGRARKVSVTVADRVMRQVSEYPAPEPTTRLGTETE